MDGHPTLVRGWTESRLQAGSPSTRDFTDLGLSVGRTGLDLSPLAGSVSEHATADDELSLNKR